jgi:hypothetical protein
LLGTLGDDFFILSNNFLKVVKLHVFRRKKIDTLGDVLTTPNSHS